MKLSPDMTRRLGLGTLAAVLLVAIAFVMLRSGPLAPTRVTVVLATEGQLTPALFGVGTVEARRSYLVGPTTAGRAPSCPRQRRFRARRAPGDRSGRSRQGSV